MEQIEHLLESLRVLPYAAALAFAYVLALPIGWDREHNERSAGLRTFPLVAVASCGFVQATEGITGNSPEAQARIIEGLITGIGFIGGGAIIKQAGAVRGLPQPQAYGRPAQSELRSAWAAMMLPSWSPCSPSSHSASCPQ